MNADTARIWSLAEYSTSSVEQQRGNRVAVSEIAVPSKQRYSRSPSPRRPRRGLLFRAVRLSRKLTMDTLMVEDDKKHPSAKAEMPPAELVKERAFDIKADALRDLEALADEQNVDLQTLADEAFADLLKKQGRGRPGP